jgi:hypothetical protein
MDTKIGETPGTKEALLHFSAASLRLRAFALKIRAPKHRSPGVKKAGVFLRYRAM